VFSVELKFKINGKEVAWEIFANRFLVDAFRSVVNEIDPRQTPTPPPGDSSMMKKKLHPQMLDVNEAAQLLGLKPSTIRDWILRRKIAHVKLGGRVFIRKEAIDDIIQQSTRPAGSH
jgi:excisionase family DNA binding protein